MLDITKKIKKVTLNGENWEIDVSKKKIIVDNLPEAFSGFGFIYSFMIDENNILLSSNVTDCGLWLYSIKNNTYEQLYSSGASWRYFIKLIDNTILISSGATTGFLVYNPLDKTINKYGSSSTTSFGVLDNGKIVLYGGAPYSWLYNPQDKTAKQLVKASVFGKLSNGDYFLSYSGISIYDANTDERITARGNVRFQFYKELPNGNVLFGSDGHWSSGNFGVILYNATERTSTTLFTTTSTENYWPIFLTLTNNSCLCISQKGTGKFYNSSDGSVTDVFSWNTSISEQYYNQQILDLENGKAIFSGFANGSYGNNAGLFLFDYENVTISKIYSGYGNYKLILLDNGNVFIYGTGYKNFGITLYNTTDSTLTTIKANTSYTMPYSNAYKLPNGNVLVSGENYSQQYGMYLYNYLDGTFTQVSPIRYEWDIYEPQENGDIIIKSSTSDKYTIKYLNDTGTVEFNTYYFGEV